MSQPFWEAGYADPDGPSVFGAPSEEIRSLLGRLPPAARVLDLGCGDGRNALPFLERGFRVAAVDVSENAIAKLEARARPFADRLSAAVADIREYRPDGRYELIIAHGVLHLVPRADWKRLIRTMRRHTASDGYNAVAVFTDVLAPPPDLEPFMSGLFREGELVEQYRGWNVELHRSYVLEDEHPGGLRHRHPVNKIVARKPPR